MKTPSHAAIGWLMCRHPSWPSHLPTTAVVAGSVAPDVPIVLAFAWIGIANVLSGAEGSTVAAFRAAYESDPILIASHQIRHAPISLAALFVAALTGPAAFESEC